MRPDPASLRPAPLLLLLSCLVLLPGAAGGTDHWRLDLSRATVQFSINVLGLFDVDGRFERVSGDMLLDEHCTASAITFTIDAASINTRNTQRDRFLRSAALLDTDNFPRVTFTSRRIILAGDGPGVITGTLALNGVTRDVRFALRRLDPMPTGTTSGAGTSFEASANISRSAFGITALPVAVSDTIRISVRVAALPENIRLAASGH